VGNPDLDLVSLRCMTLQILRYAGAVNDVHLLLDALWQVVQVCVGASLDHRLVQGMREPKRKGSLPHA